VVAIPDDGTTKCAYVRRLAPRSGEYDLADFRAALAHVDQPGRSGKVLLRG